MRQTFDNRCLTHTGFTNEDRVVLCSTGEDLQHAANLVVATDDRVEFARLGAFAEVDCELL